MANIKDQKPSIGSRSRGLSAKLLVVASLLRRRNRAVMDVNQASRTSDDDDVSVELGLQLEAFPPEVLLGIAGFLPDSDARSLMQTNQSIRQLLIRSETLWNDLCQNQWPWLREAQREPVSSADEDRDQCSSTTTTPSDGSLPRHASFLLSLAKREATLIDESEIKACCTLLTNDDVEHVQLPNGKSQVRYTGQLAVDNRCVRANAPLPRLPPLNDPSRNGLLQRVLLRSSKSSVKDVPLFRPFVSPFITKNDQVCLAPRLVAYFEVSIRTEPAPEVDEDPESLDDEGFSTSSEQQPQQQQAPVNDCIAIGLGTRCFRLNHRMPGWNGYSIGYHSDDGGLYFGSGQMQRRCGPSFGVGDTVGCGIDYNLQTVFFTLNGRFLGNAVLLGSKFLNQDLFPVVGLDSNASVQCNFYGPFEFDLERKLKQQQQTVHQALKVIHANRKQRLQGRRSFFDVFGGIRTSS